MKKLSLLFCTIISASFLFGQNNMTLRSTVTYDENLSDVWGYEQNGREYAIVGLFDGVNIQDVTDPDNPVDMGTADGATSIWRDIKTWDGFAYITNESGGGLMVIDLRDLPTPITSADYYNWEPDVFNQGIIGACHNIFVDEFGYGYLAGCNPINSGGAIFLDLFTSPGTPILLGLGAAVYAHDIYARDNLMYTSDLTNGLAIHNVIDKTNSVVVNSFPTPFNFTHNAWLSDDSKTIFTTDERGNAPVASYDISNPLEVEELDQYYPLETLGLGVIPHNVHVWGDWLIVSYYTDGCIIIDGSRPSNLIEVGNFDTWLGGNGGFDGVWGAYPFLPSQTVLATDQTEGLFVITPDYKRACWLEGKVTNIATGENLNGVDINIDALQPNNAKTRFNGTYETGLAEAGIYEVVFEKDGFIPFVTNVDLQNGVLTELDVEMEPLLTVKGRVLNADNGSPVPFPVVSMVNNNESYTTQGKADGTFILGGFLGGNFNVYAGGWGFQTVEDVVTANVSQEIDFVVAPGYRDEFIIDLGWEVTGDAQKGHWVREEPIGTINNSALSNPEEDLAGDIGDLCYVTGNLDGEAGLADVDLGATLLTSPVMDLTTYVLPLLSVNYWFYNEGTIGPATDYMNIFVENGIEQVLLEQVTDSKSNWVGPVLYNLSDFISITDQMRITFEVADIESPNFVEGAIDIFEILDVVVSTNNLRDDYSIRAFPSPFTGSTSVVYELPEEENQAYLNLYNLLGQQIDRISINGTTGNVSIGENLQNGVYLIQIEMAGKLSKSIRVIKAN